MHIEVVFMACVRSPVSALCPRKRYIWRAMGRCCVCVSFNHFSSLAWFGAYFVVVSFHIVFLLLLLFVSFFVAASLLFCFLWLFLFHTEEDAHFSVCLLRKFNGDWRTEERQHFLHFFLFVCSFVGAQYLNVWWCLFQLFMQKLQNVVIWYGLTLGNGTEQHTEISTLTKQQLIHKRSADGK